MTFMKFERRIQKMRLLAGRFRFLICQIQAGKSSSIVRSERSGIAMAAGERPSSGTNPSMEAVLLVIDMFIFYAQYYNSGEYSFQRSDRHKKVHNQGVMIEG